MRTSPFSEDHRVKWLDAQAPKCCGVTSNHRASVMTKTSAILGSIAFFLIAPGTLAGALPWLISKWEFAAPMAGVEASRGVGAVLIALGLIPLIDSFRRFAMEGLGTPAPVLPTQRLIVSGFYRHVRNPMYVGVIAVVLGQSILFGNAALLAYAAIIWLGFHIFVMAYEEPTLKRVYGSEYDVYCQNVPRWLPRLSEYTPA